MQKRGRGGGYDTSFEMGDWSVVLGPRYYSHVCVCYLSVAFTSCDMIMADYNNIDDIRRQKKAEYNRRYKKAKEGGI